jgi:hypothetical protein
MWRFRLIIVAGLLLGLLMAFLSYTRVSLDHGKPKISYRQAETWRSQNLVFITQRGFPWGRTVFPFNPQSTPTGTQVVPSDFADPARFSQLATYYAQFANSDAVQILIAKRARDIPGSVSAQVLTDPSGRFPLPFVQILGLGPTPAAASSLANKGAGAFIDYLREQQAAAGIPEGQRVELRVSTRARGAILLAGRRKTTPVVIFLTLMLAAIGLAFILENLRPRVQLVSGGAGEERDAVGGRKSA